MVERMGSLTDLGYGLGKNWEDPRWEEVLDQLTFSDMEKLFLHGYVKTEPLSVLGKPLAREADGPAQIGSFHQIPAGTGFPIPAYWLRPGITHWPGKWEEQLQKKQASLVTAAGMLLR